MSGWCDRCGFDYRQVLGLPHRFCWDGVADAATVLSWVEAATGPRETRLVADCVGRLRSLDNNERNGRYWWAKGTRIAIEQLSARRCRHPGDNLAPR